MMSALKKLILVLSVFSFYSLSAQVTLSTDFTDDAKKNQPLHNIWSIANRISPTNGSNIRPGLKMNTVRMIGGIKKTVNGNNVKDLDFDTCLYDSINNIYVYRFEPLIERINKIINSQTEIHQIVLDQPSWAFQHGYTFIPEGTRDNINFRENEQISIYGNSLPPANKEAYHDYIKALISKLVETYGEEKVMSWRFRVGSEIETPDHWFGTKQDFIEHFENTEKAVRAILPNAIVGLHTRAPDFLYKNGTILNYKGEPFASFAEGLIEYCADNNVQYDFWGISDYVVLGSASLRNMSAKYDKLFADLVNHPKWNANATIDLMEYATVTTMDGADGNGFINAETTHAEIVELYFSNIYYKNKDKGLDYIYRWGNRTGSQDPPGISVLNSMNEKNHYTTVTSGSPQIATNDLGAIFAKKENALEYDVLVYNYNNSSLSYGDSEDINLSFTSELSAGTTLYYRNISYDKTNNKLQNFLENTSGFVKSGFNERGSPDRILTDEGLAAYEAYENPNPYKYSEWESIETIARNDGKSGSVITLNTEIPSFAFEKIEFRTNTNLVTELNTPQYKWTTDEDFQQFSTSQMSSSIAGGKINMTITGSFPNLIYDTSLYVDNFDSFKIDIKNITNSDIFWFVWYKDGVKNQRRFRPGINETSFNTYTVDLSSDADWNGTIDSFNIEIANRSSLGGTVEIDSIELVLKAGVEEHTITTNIVEGSGVVSPSGGKVFTGNDVTFNAYPDAGWVFQDWSGDVVSTENPLKISITSDLNIRATFVQESLSTDKNTVIDNFIVYPNPSSKGVFTIKNDTKENWEVYNLNGAKVLSGKEEIIDVSKFSKGIYILKHNNSYKKLLYN
ncbi:T9SS type A sorting domain-containing protein [uncultured Polaribacter sp.]|uniref:GH39 family glycosyl hydrolase n=1 Tax=uncultured Polaribacter sp. TaxID=174711 RepID=UPI0026305A45|nr:T9SS type A sorting domain-containing protein [uncultured Polaribacter sp.]